MTKSNLEKNFEYILKDFESDPDRKTVWHEHELGFKTIKENKIALPADLQIQHPFIVFIIFVYLKGFKFSGRWEKIAWTIPIKFKGQPYLLTHRKFGFYIISNSDEEKVTALGIEAMSQIKKAIHSAEGLIQPYVKDKVNKGEFSVNNEYHKIQDKYLFFRDAAKTEYEKIKKLDSKKRKIRIENFADSFNGRMALVKAADYNASAMIDAYFSLLEHILVLLVPFSKHVDHSTFKTEEFIGMNWKDKYKIIFQIISDVESLKQMEKLTEIKEAFRNPLAHGYFFKNGNSFFVHMEHIGAIPFSLTKNNGNLIYGMEKIGSFNFSQICRAFDDFDKFLHKNIQSKFGMLYIKSGLLIAFTKDISEYYQSFMTSMRKFNNFIEYQSSLADDASNMDW